MAYRNLLLYKKPEGIIEQVKYGKISLKNLILFIYFVTIFILLMDCTDNFPFTENLREIKYIFIGLLIVDFIINGFKSQYKFRKSSLFILFFFFLHTILFGLIFVNPTVAELTSVHFREMMIYLLLLAFLVYAVEKYDCRAEFIKLTALACGIFMLWCGLTHFGDFVNPIYFIYVFSRAERIRAAFGTSNYNYMGFYTVVSLAFYYATWCIEKRQNNLTTLKKIIILLISFWTLAILFSTSSRSSILSVLVFVIVWFYQSIVKRTFSRKTAYLIGALFIILLIVAIIVLGEDIWADANRDGNYEINLPIFEQMGAFWTGMGYIENAGFLSGAYGYETFPVDVYYLYIYLSTGVIGSVIIAIPLIYMLIKLIRKKTWFAQIIGLSIYIAMLFDAFWQVNLFTYRYIPTLFLAVLIITAISKKEEITFEKTK